MEERYDARNLKPFEEKVIASGLCDFSLPAAFVTVNDVRQAIYDSSGYTRLDGLEFANIDEMLELLEKSMANLKKAGEFLIDPDQIVLNGKTIFMDRRRRDVKFVYVPSRMQRPMQNVLELTDYLENQAQPIQKQILSRLSDTIKEEHLSLKESATRTAVVRREIRKIAGL